MREEQVVKREIVRWYGGHMPIDTLTGSRKNVTEHKWRKSKHERQCMQWLSKNREMGFSCGIEVVEGQTWIFQVTVMIGINYPLMLRDQVRTSSAMSRDYATRAVTSMLFCYPWGLNSVRIKTVPSSCDSRELPAWVFLCSLKLKEFKKLRFKGKIVFFF